VRGAGAVPVLASIPSDSGLCPWRATPTRRLVPHCSATADGARKRDLPRGATSTPGLKRPPIPHDHIRGRSPAALL